jgi:hypothetical protein
MKKAFVTQIVALLSVSLILSGCALVNGTTQKVMITSNVQGASIMVDGHPKGKTQDTGVPIVVHLKRNTTHSVSAEKEGYSSRYVMVDSQLCTLGILDVIGIWFFLLPGISLLTGGAFELTPNEVYIPLDKK